MVKGCRAGVRPFVVKGCCRARGPSLRRRWYRPLLATWPSRCRVCGGRPRLPEAGGQWWGWNRRLGGSWGCVGGLGWRKPAWLPRRLWRGRVLRRVRAGCVRVLRRVSCLARKLCWRVGCRLCPCPCFWRLPLVVVVGGGDGEGGGGVLSGVSKLKISRFRDSEPEIYTYNSRNVSKLNVGPNGWVNCPMDGWMDGKIDGLNCGKMIRWVGGWMGGWTDGWMGGWMDGRMDGFRD